MIFGGQTNTLLNQGYETSKWWVRAFIAELGWQAVLELGRPWEGIWKELELSSWWVGTWETPLTFPCHCFLLSWFFDEDLIITSMKIMNYELGCGILRCWNRNWETTQLLPVKSWRSWWWLIMLIAHYHCCDGLRLGKITQLPPVMPHLRFSIVAERFQIFGKPCRTFSGVISTPRFSP